MAIQKRLSLVSLARQSAKGAAASAGTYKMGVSGGTIAGAEINEEDLPVTWSNRIAEGSDRISVLPGAEFDLVAMPKTIGLLLLGACGADTVAGAMAPYSHTFKSATDLPYLTLFGTYAGEWLKMSDAKVDSLELTWEQTGAVRGKARFVGCDLDYLAMAYTEGTAERPADGVFKGAGGTFEVDGVSATIKSGSISIANGIEPIFGSASPTPEDVFPALQTVTFSLVVVPTSTSAFRTVLTGADDGTAISAAPYEGSAEAKFILDTDTDLTFNALNARIATDFPESDPAGGAAEVTLEGSIVIPPGGGDAYSVVLRNGIASYTS